MMPTRTKQQTGHKRDAEGYDRDGFRVVWANNENVCTDEQWRAWLAAGCPRDDVRPERDTDYKVTTSSDGRVKVRPPYHAISDNGKGECAKCGRPVVASPTTRSGLKHRDGWA